MLLWADITIGCLYDSINQISKDEEYEIPFIFVYGVPDTAEKDTLRLLRRDIVATVVEAMDCEQSWVRVFFPTFHLEEPQDPEEGCHTIYVAIDTGMFTGSAVANREVQNVTDAIGNVIFDAFRGRREVEVFIRDLNNRWKTLLPPALETFTHEYFTDKVSYKGISIVAPGVTRVAYGFHSDPSRDLAVVRIAPGYGTPLQVVKLGHVIEGYISGKGMLTLMDESGETHHEFLEGDPFIKKVWAGHARQWSAINTDLTIYEIYFPLYKDGTFQTIE